MFPSNGLAEDDWDGWRLLTDKLGPRIQLVGDDLFTTNLQRLDKGIALGVANAVLVKMNQIGGETLPRSTAHAAPQDIEKNGDLQPRSGATEGIHFLQTAVASGAGQIKIGSITRSERLAKYNRLLEIERWGDLEYNGPLNAHLTA